MVVEVDLPCAGAYLGTKYNSTNNCRTQELYTWLNMADDYARLTLKLNISAIKQRVAVLPTEMDPYCGWAGERAQRVLHTQHKDGTLFRCLPV